MFSQKWPGLNEAEITTILWYNVVEGVKDLYN